MPRQELAAQGRRRRGPRTGSLLFAASAGMAVLCTGATAAALGGAHAAASEKTSAGQCQAGTTLTRVCVTVQPAASTAEPGQPAVYDIRFSRAGLAALSDVTVRISATSSGSSPRLPPPAFTDCGQPDGTQACAAGMPAPGQAATLQAQIRLPGAAPAGDTATLSATVTGTLLGLITTSSATSSATIAIVTDPASPPRPSPSGHVPPGSGPPGAGHPGPEPGHGRGSGLRPARSPRYPGLSGTLALGSTPFLPRVDGGGAGLNPSSLFPVIRPSGSGRPQARGLARPYHATSAPGVLPLGTRQLRIQTAGVIVLALGIIIAAARISLRKPGPR